MDITSDKLKNKRYHTVGTVPKSNRKTRDTTLSDQQKNKRYHTVGTVPKSNRKTRDTTLSKQFQNLTEKQQIPHSWNGSKI